MSAHEDHTCAVSSQSYTLCMQVNVKVVKQTGMLLADDVNMLPSNTIAICTLASSVHLPNGTPAHSFPLEGQMEYEQGR